MEYSIDPEGGTICIPCLKADKTRLLKEVASLEAENAIYVQAVSAEMLNENARLTERVKAQEQFIADWGASGHEWQKENAALAGQVASFRHFVENLVKANEDDSMKEIRDGIFNIDPRLLNFHQEAKDLLATTLSTYEEEWKALNKVAGAAQAYCHSEEKHDEEYFWALYQSLMNLAALRGNR